MCAVVRTIWPSAAVLRQLVGIHVRLAKENRVTVSPLHVLTPIVENREVQRPRVQAGLDLLEDEGGSIYPESGRAEL
jgi:hypothetical protein